MGELGTQIVYVYAFSRRFYPKRLTNEDIKIGDSVVNRLLANQTAAPIRDSPPPTTPPLLNPSPFSPDMSRLSVVVKTDAKEPAVYRGDSTDKYTVQEWIDVMDTYLNKKGCSIVEQVDEILGHLLGQKSNSDKAANPEIRESQESGQRRSCLKT